MRREGGEVTKGQWKVEPEFYTETCDHAVEPSHRPFLLGKRRLIFFYIQKCFFFIWEMNVCVAFSLLVFLCNLNIT